MQHFFEALVSFIQVFEQIIELFIVPFLLYVAVAYLSLLNFHQTF